MKDLTIVGGGITGLTAAYVAAKAGHKVRVIEGSNEFGGLLKTFGVGGTQLECFYHHFFLHDKELHWLLNELNLIEKIVSRETTMGVYSDKKIHPFSNAKDLLRFSPLNFFDKLRFGLSTIYLGKLKNWRNAEGISAISWFNKWTGKNVVKKIWGPLLKVKFGKFYDKVPLAWMIGRLKQRFESREAGSEKLLYIDGSFTLIVERLLSKLAELEVELILNTKIDNLVFEKNNLIGVSNKEQTYFSKKILFTIPQNVTSKLLNKKISFPKVEYFGATCVILELSESLSPVYWLNIADENIPFGGVIEHTNFIDSTNYNGTHILYLSKYFALDEPIAKMHDTEIKQLMINSLALIFPKFEKGSILRSHIFRSNSAAPVCDLNFSEKIPNAKTNINNLYVCNMAHIYPDERSVNNSIRIATNACSTIGISNTVPEGNSLSGLIGFDL